MLYDDIGNTLRGGLRTGIQRVVRSLAYELAVNSGVETRLIAFDVGAGSYFALADPTLIRSADSLAEIGRDARAYFDLDTFGKGDIFFEPDSSWTEPLNRGALFRRLKAKGVIVVVLNHDAIPILPEVCHRTRRLLRRDHRRSHPICHYALAASARVARDLCAVASTLGRSMSTRVIKLGADFATPSSGTRASEPGTTPSWSFRACAICSQLGRSSPRARTTRLLQAFDGLSAKDAGPPLSAAKGDGRYDRFLTGVTDFGKRGLLDRPRRPGAASSLYRGAYAGATVTLRRIRATGGGGAVARRRYRCPDAGPCRKSPRVMPYSFSGADGEALFSILNRLYGDPDYYAGLNSIGEELPSHGRARGGIVLGVRLGEVCWIPLLPPDKPGLYAIRFFAALDSGARLEARGLLTVVADEGRE
jgi:hypothetical protein